MVGLLNLVRDNDLNLIKHYMVYKVKYDFTNI